MSEEGYSSPLVDIVMSKVSTLSSSISREQLVHFRKVLEQYLAKQIDFKAVSDVLLAYTNSTQPLDFLQAILNTSNNPIQPQADIDNPIGKKRKKTRNWTSYEDQRLIAGIHKFGLDNWPLIATFVGNGRSRSQCSQRWCRGLDPKISKDQWTKEEEEKLIKLIIENKGKGWTIVASGMGNRSDVQCRYHYKQLMREAKALDPEMNWTKLIKKDEKPDNVNDKQPGVVPAQQTEYIKNVHENQKVPSPMPPVLSPQQHMMFNQNSPNAFSGNNNIREVESNEFSNKLSPNMQHPMMQQQNIPSMMQQPQQQLASPMNQIPQSMYTNQYNQMMQYQQFLALPPQQQQQIYRNHQMMMSQSMLMQQQMLMKEINKKTKKTKTKKVKETKIQQPTQIIQPQTNQQQMFPGQSGFTQVGIMSGYPYQQPSFQGYNNFGNTQTSLPQQPVEPVQQQEQSTYLQATTPDLPIESQPSDPLIQLDSASSGSTVIDWIMDNQGDMF